MERSRILKVSNQIGTSHQIRSTRPRNIRTLSPKTETLGVHRVTVEKPGTVISVKVTGTRATILHGAYKDTVRVKVNLRKINRRTHINHSEVT